MKVKIQNFSEQISEISNKSTLELDLENVKYFRSKLYKNIKLVSIYISGYKKYKRHMVRYKFTLRNIQRQRNSLCESK